MTSIRELARSFNGVQGGIKGGGLGVRNPFPPYKSFFNLLGFLKKKIPKLNFSVHKKIFFITLPTKNYWIRP